MKNGMSDADYRLQLIKDLIEIVEELEWNIAIPNTNEDDEVQGMIIGTEEYLDSILEDPFDTGIVN